MRLSDDDTRAVYHCVSIVVRSHGNAGHPIPYWLQRLFDRLDLQVRLMARGGHESGTNAADSDPWITTRQAAQHLELSPRQTRRLTTDLEGELFNGRLMFRTSSVRNYAEGRRSD